MEKFKLRNWRTLLAETGIIVLGVSIALIAQQAVDWWHWRSEVAQARSVIATEMASNLRIATFRLRTQKCTEHRLDELSRILDEASRSGNLPPVGAIDTPPRGYWANGAWESLVASQTATHFPRQQLADLTTIYKRVERLDLFSTQEVATWTSLYAMVGPGRRLDPASEARLREVLSQARTINRLMAVIGAQMISRTKALGLRFEQRELKIIADAKNGTLLTAFGTLETGASAFGAICQPIGAVPPVYGQGFFGAVPNMMDEAVKNLPDFGEGAH